MILVPIHRDGRVDSQQGVPLPPVADKAIGQTVELYAKRGFVEPWICYVAMEGSICVGTCGFTSPPADGIVEIAYFTFPGFEGHGVATAMAKRLVATARGRDPAVRIIAHTLCEENASTRILRKTGFELAGPIDHPEDGTIWKWDFSPRVDSR